jgi:hypothetical protein
MIFDGLKKENFLLRSYIILWTGDIPAMTKVMHLTGHNSYMGCRFCYIKGTYCQQSRHIYYPCNPSELIKRDENSFKQDIALLESKDKLTDRKFCMKQTGKILCLI